VTFKNSANNVLAPTKKVTVGSATVSGNSDSRKNSILVKQTVVVNEAKLHKVYFSAATSLTITLPYTSDEQRQIYKGAGRVKFFSENSADSVVAVIAPLATYPAQTVSDTLGTVTWLFNAPAGYSWISFDPAVATAITFTPAKTYTFRFNYLTEIFTCPFLP
jgi:hypothetical protein